MRGESWFRQIDCLVFISKLNIKKKKKKKKRRELFVCTTFKLITVLSSSSSIRFSASNELAKALSISRVEFVRFTCSLQIRSRDAIERRQLKCQQAFKSHFSPTFIPCPGIRLEYTAREIPESIKERVIQSSNERIERRTVSNNLHTIRDQVFSGVRHSTTETSFVQAKPRTSVSESLSGEINR